MMYSKLASLTRRTLGLTEVSELDGLGLGYCYVRWLETSGYSEEEITDLKGVLGPFAPLDVLVPLLDLSRLYRRFSLSFCSNVFHVNDFVSKCYLVDMLLFADLREALLGYYSFSDVKNLGYSQGYCYLQWFRDLGFPEEHFPYIVNRFGPYPLVRQLFIYLYRLSEGGRYMMSGFRFVTSNLMHVDMGVKCVTVLDLEEFLDCRVGATIAAPLAYVLENALTAEELEQVTLNVASDLMRTTQAKEELVRAAAERAKARCDSVKRRVIVIPHRLDATEESILVREFPCYELKFLGRDVHPHALLAAQRSIQTEYILDELNYSRCGKSVKDFGGDVVLHLARDRFDIHCCAPLIDSRDGQRASKRVLRLVDMLRDAAMPSRKRNDILNLIRPENIYKIHCNNKGQDCHYLADALMFIHSSYDNRAVDYADAMDSAHASEARGVMLWDPKILFSFVTKGSILGGRVTWEKIKMVKGYSKLVSQTDNVGIEDVYIRFAFKNDSSYSYTHRLIDYLAIPTSNMIYSSSGNLYFVEHDTSSDRAGSLYFTIVKNLVSSVPRSRVTHSIWLGIEDSVLVCVPQVVDGARTDMREKYELKRFFAKKKFVSEIQTYLYSLNNQKFSLDVAKLYARCRSARVTMNGVDIIENNSLSYTELCDTVLGVYIQLFRDRYDQGQIVKDFINTEDGDRKKKTLSLLEVLKSFFYGDNVIGDDCDGNKLLIDGNGELTVHTRKDFCKFNLSIMKKFLSYFRMPERVHMFSKAGVRELNDKVTYETTSKNCKMESFGFEEIVFKLPNIKVVETIKRGALLEDVFKKEVEKHIDEFMLDRGFDVKRKPKREHRNNSVLSSKCSNDLQLASEISERILENSLIRPSAPPLNVVRVGEKYSDEECKLIPIADKFLITLPGRKPFFPEQEYFHCSAVNSRTRLKYAKGDGLCLLHSFADAVGLKREASEIREFLARSPLRELLPNHTRELANELDSPRKSDGTYEMCSSAVAQLLAIQYGVDICIHSHTHEGLVCVRLNSGFEEKRYIHLQLKNFHYQPYDLPRPHMRVFKEGAEYEIKYQGSLEVLRENHALIYDVRCALPMDESQPGVRGKDRLEPDTGRPEGWLARSVLKISELVQAQKIELGDSVLDIGCAPGSVLQYLMRSGVKSVVGITPQRSDITLDLSQVPIPEGQRLTIDYYGGTGDVTEKSAMGDFISRNGHFDTVICDACAVTGCREEQQEDVNFPIWDGAVFLALGVVKANGTFIIKLLDTVQDRTWRMIEQVCANFTEVSFVKPLASRAASSEVYLVARGRTGAPIVCTPERLSALMFERAIMQKRQLVFLKRLHNFILDPSLKVESGDRDYLLRTLPPIKRDEVCYRSKTVVVNTTLENLKGTICTSTRGGRMMVSSFHICRLRFQQGNLFSSILSKAHCVSADLRMSAGIAPDFVRHVSLYLPELDIRAELGQQNLSVGSVGMITVSPKLRFFFLITKARYFEKPKERDFAMCVSNLSRLMRTLGLHEVAIPAIGCGRDRLNFDWVVKQLEREMRDLCVTMYLEGEPLPDVILSADDVEVEDVKESVTEEDAPDEVVKERFSMFEETLEEDYLLDLVDESIESRSCTGESPVATSSSIVMGDDEAPAITDERGVKAVPGDSVVDVQNEKYNLAPEQLRPINLVMVRFVDKRQVSFGSYVLRGSELWIGCRHIKHGKFSLFSAVSEISVCALKKGLYKYSEYVKGDAFQHVQLPASAKIYVDKGFFNDKPVNICIRIEPCAQDVDEVYPEYFPCKKVELLIAGREYERRAGLMIDGDIKVYGRSGVDFVHCFSQVAGKFQKELFECCVQKIIERYRSQHIHIVIAREYQHLFLDLVRGGDSSGLLWHVVNRSEGPKMLKEGEDFKTGEQYPKRTFFPEIGKKVSTFVHEGKEFVESRTGRTYVRKDFFGLPIFKSIESTKEKFRLNDKRTDLKIVNGFDFRDLVIPPSSPSGSSTGVSAQSLKSSVVPVNDSGLSHEVFNKKQYCHFPKEAPLVMHMPVSGAKEVEAVKLKFHRPGDDVSCHYPPDIRDELRVAIKSGVKFTYLYSDTEEVLYCFIFTDKKFLMPNLKAFILHINKKDYSPAVIYYDDCEMSVVNSICKLMSTHKDFRHRMVILTNTDRKAQRMVDVLEQHGFIKLKVEEDINITQERWKEANEDFATLYKPVEFETNDLCINVKARNAILERIELWSATETIIKRDLKAQHTAFTHSIVDGKISPALLGSLRATSNEMNIYDTKEKKFIFKFRVDSDVRHEACFDGEEILNFDDVRKGKRTSKRYVILTKETVLMNDVRLAAACADLKESLSQTDFNYAMPKLELIQGVPGAGKTSEIINTYVQGQDYILAQTSEGAKDIKERYKNQNPSNSAALDTIRTCHSFIINHMTTSKSYQRLLVDEALMTHPGEIFIIAFALKAKVVRLFGDFRQIPYIDRLSLGTKYDSWKLFVAPTELRRVSYRCTNTIAALFTHLKFYESGMVSTSSVRNELKLTPFTSLGNVKKSDDCVYLTFKQLEKYELMTHGFKNVYTIHEYQGKQADNIVVVRTDQKIGTDLFKKEEHCIVAISRHKKSFEYVTPFTGTDLLARWVTVAQNLPDKIFKECLHSVDCKGGQLEVKDFNDGYLGEVELVENVDSRIYDATVRWGFEPFSHVRFISTGVAEEGLKKCTGGSHPFSNDPAVIQNFLNEVLPRNSGHPMDMDVEFVNYLDPLNLDTENFITVDRSKVREPKVKQFDKLKPVILSSMPDPRPDTAVESLLSLRKRNWGVPELSSIVDPETIAETMLCCVVNSIFENSKLLNSYSKDIIHPNPAILKEWLDTQPTCTVDQINHPDELSVFEIALNKYKFMIKSSPKPDLTLSAPYQYSSLQTIAYHEKDINAIFCPVFKIIKERILSVLPKRFKIFTNISPEEFAQSVTESGLCRVLKRTTGIEVDISKYDKSQGLIALLYECKYMRLFGVPEDLIKLWYNAHVDTVLEDRNNGIKCRVKYQRKSGDASTFIGNTMFLIGVMAMVFDMNSVTFAAFAGDDSIIFGPAILQTSGINQLCANIFNLETKIFCNFKYSYFCSKFLLFIDDQCYFVPDLVKLCVKLGRKDMVNHEHVEQYRVSLTDLTACFKDPKICADLSAAIAERYNAKISNISLLLGTLQNLINDKTEFGQLFYSLPGDRICMDPSLPKFD